MSAEQPITKANLLFFQEFNSEVDVFGTVVSEEESVMICHQFVYSYLKGIGILPTIHYDKILPSKVYTDHGFKPVTGAPIAGDVILLGGDSHSMIVLAPDIWAGTNNVGFFGKSVSSEHLTHLPKKCVIQIVGEDMSQGVLNLKHYPSDKYPISFQAYRHSSHTFPPFDPSELSRRWSSVSSGCCEIL